MTGLPTCLHEAATNVNVERHGCQEHLRLRLQPSRAPSELSATRGPKQQRPPESTRQSPAETGKDHTPQTSPGSGSGNGIPTAPGRKFGKGHQVFASGCLHWCRKCGAYAEQRFKSLKDPCLGPAGTGPRAGQLARLLRGEHPLKKGERMPRPVRVTGLGN